MAVFETGTATISTLGSWQNISTPAWPGIYTLVLDTSNLQAGETLDVDLQIKVVSADPVKTAFSFTYSGVQTAEPVKVHVPVAAPFTANFRIKQTGGTARAFPWTVMGN